MTLCIKLESYGAILFLRIFRMIFRMSLMYENGRGMFKILEKLKNIGFGGC